jgi:hypothetical protein
MLCCLPNEMRKRHLEAYLIIRGQTHTVGRDSVEPFSARGGLISFDISSIPSASLWKTLPLMDGRIQEVLLQLRERFVPIQAIRLK